MSKFTMFTTLVLAWGFLGSQAQAQAGSHAGYDAYTGETSAEAYYTGEFGRARTWSGDGFARGFAVSVDGMQITYSNSWAARTAVGYPAAAMFGLSIGPRGSSHGIGEAVARGYAPAVHAGGYSSHHETEVQTHADGDYFRANARSRSLR